MQNVGIRFVAERWSEEIPRYIDKSPGHRIRRFEKKGRFDPRRLEKIKHVMTSNK